MTCAVRYANRTYPVPTPSTPTGASRCRYPWKGSSRILGSPPWRGSCAGPSPTTCRICVEHSGYFRSMEPIATTTVSPAAGERELTHGRQPDGVSHGCSNGIGLPTPTSAGNPASVRRPHRQGGGGGHPAGLAGRLPWNYVCATTSAPPLRNWDHFAPVLSVEARSRILIRHAVQIGLTPPLILAGS